MPKAKNKNDKYARGWETRRKNKATAIDRSTQGDSLTKGPRYPRAKMSKSDAAILQDRIDIGVKKLISDKPDARAIERIVHHDEHLTTQGRQANAQGKLTARVYRTEDLGAPALLNQANRVQMPGLSYVADMDVLIGQAHDAVGRSIPGRGEIVGGEHAALADGIMKVARQKNGAIEAVQELIASYGQLRENLGASKSRQDEIRKRKEMREEADRRIVCGFLAEVDDAMSRDGGMPPTMVWTINSYVVARLSEALNRAGYFSAGYRDPNGRGSADTEARR